MSRTSVLTDPQWKRIEPLQPSSEDRHGRPLHDDLPGVERILHQYWCGIVWRDVPERFGS